MQIEDLIEQETALPDFGVSVEQCFAESLAELKEVTQAYRRYTVIGEGISFDSPNYPYADKVNAAMTLIYLHSKVDTLPGFFPFDAEIKKIADWLTEISYAA